MRINVHGLPGVQTERTLTLNNEERREDVFVNGTYVGQIVYVRRKRKVGSEYGWRDAKANPRVSLRTMTEAVRDVLARKAS